MGGSTPPSSAWALVSSGLASVLRGLARFAACVAPLRLMPSACMLALHRASRAVRFHLCLVCQYWCPGASGAVPPHVGGRCSGPAGPCAIPDLLRCRRPSLRRCAALGGVLLSASRCSQPAPVLVPAVLVSASGVRPALSCRPCPCRPCWPWSLYTKPTPPFSLDMYVTT